jgi:cyclopropane fatty-acyl-phospholipid synthase-like methyltransferase
MGFSIIDDIGGIEKIQQMSDEEYESIKQYVFDYLKKNSPGLYHIVCGHTPRELFLLFFADFISPNVFLDFPFPNP